MNKKTKTSFWIRKLDRIFSQYIRLKDSKNGYVKCFTCGKLCQIKNIDCGHYISRRYKSIRYSEKNSNPQCRYCNRYLFGAMDIYALNLQKKYGENILKELNKEKNRIKQFTIQELQDLTVLYKDKIDKLLKTKTFKL